MTSDVFLELKQITRRFGEFEALRGVTLQLKPGRIGLLGPNGAGKSTLLKILMGLLPPTSGTGQILGQPVGESLEENFRLRQLIGFMSEADSLVPGLTGIEYVGLAGELYGMPRRQAARRAHEVLTYLGLEEARYRKVEDYSAGMKQRVKLAQAIVHDPPAILLDEPTSGLDPAGRDTMLKLITELATSHGKTILLSTHLLADVQTVCDQVVIISGGLVRGQGSVAELCSVRKDRFRLRTQGETARFIAELDDQGVQLLSENGRGELRVVVPSGWANWQFFQVALKHGVTLRAILKDDETLEELFLRTVQAA
ncbi:MAG: ABC transporter ATP-binding protein [Fimbriiglobus sp.]